MKKLFLVPLFSFSLFVLDARWVVAADPSGPMTECELEWRLNPQASADCAPVAAIPPPAPSGTATGMGARRRIVMAPPTEAEAAAALPQQTAGIEIAPPVPEARPTLPVAPAPTVPRLSGYTLEDVTFDTGSARLKPTALAALTQIGHYLVRKSQIRLSIGGHTDEVGSPLSNQILSEARADAVRRFLVDMGVEAQRLTSQGFGEDRLLPEFDGRDRRQRRVELRPQ